MKPTNLINNGCSPVSSDCVIWQGPDIECINLCKGDSVSIVVFKLATELCKIIDYLDLNNYNISCLNLGNCGPKEFDEFIQIIINKICALEGCCENNGGGNSNPSISGCPDCIVNIAPCFNFTDPKGNTVTTMQLIDYVTAIGNRICNILNNISTINQVLQNLDNRITIIENQPPPTFTLPKVTPNCVTSQVGTAQEMNIVLTALENQFCQLQQATGNAPSILNGISYQCPDLNNALQMSGTGIMGTLNGWVTSVSNLAQSITNMWLTICDLRTAVLDIQKNCCPNGCDGVNINIQSVLENANSLKLFFNGTIPQGFTECNSNGTLFTITDQSNGTLTLPIIVLNNMNNSQGFTINLQGTPINTMEDLQISATFCVTDGVSQCQSVINHVSISTLSCPNLTVIPNSNSINYQYNWSGGTAIIEAQLWNQQQTIMLQSQTTNVSASGNQSGSFTGLTGSTQYFVRLIITISGNTTTCNFTPVNTTVALCLPPTNLIAEIII
jgi:hypothetical protein